MTSKPLNERLQNDEENLIDRRRFSEDSKDHVAELIQNGKIAEASEILFRVLTGDRVVDYTPTRTVQVPVELSNSVVTELGTKRLQMSVTVGTETRIQTLDSDIVSADRGFGNQPDGTYSISATVDAVYENDPDTLERTEYAVDSSSVSVSQLEVTVDTSTDTYGADIVVGPITVDELTVGSQL